MGRPDASPRDQINQESQAYHFQSVAQAPETIDDAHPVPFESANEENQQENYENEPSEEPLRTKQNGQNNQQGSQFKQQSQPTSSANVSSQSQPTRPMAFPPQSSQPNCPQAAVQFPPQQHKMRSPPSDNPSQASPQAFPPQAIPQPFPPQASPQAFPPQAIPQPFPPQASPQDFPPQSQAAQPQAFPSQSEAAKPQAFPPQASPQAFPPQSEAAKPQAFPPTQGEPQAFPPQQGKPQAFPPQDDQPQAFPPPQDEPVAFPPAQGQPHAFPPSQGQPQAFPPTQTQAQAFPSQQTTFQQPNVMQFPPDANFSQPGIVGGGQMGPQAMPTGLQFHPNAQVMMNNRTTGFPMVQVPTEAWKTGLFECMNDPGNALITACFPCVTFGQIAEIVDSGQSSCGTSGMLYSLIACFIAMPCLMSSTYRTKLRGRFGLIETPAPDWIIHCFCECCALCQEYRELQLRGLDPSIGWLGNVAKSQQQVQLGAMTPPMKQTMMG